MLSKSIFSNCQKQVLNQPKLIFPNAWEAEMPVTEENEEEYKWDSTHPRGCISFKQIIYSAGGLGGVIWRTWGGVRLALGGVWIPSEAKGLPHYHSAKVEVDKWSRRDKWCLKCNISNLSNIPKRSNYSFRNGALVHSFCWVCINKVQIICSLVHMVSS